MLGRMMAQAENLIRAAMRMRGYRSRFVPTSLGVLHVMEVEGDGPLPPIALVHGLSSTGIHFLPMLPALRARCRRLILPDLPGHGLSSLPPPGTRIPAIERGLTEMLDAVLDEPTVIFGSSLGGVASVRYALARPSQVQGLVLSSPAGARCDAAELRRILKQFHIDSHSMALDFVDRLLELPWAARHALALGVRARFGPEALQALLAALTPEDLLKPEELRRLSVPTAVIWGRKDRILPRSHLEFYRTHLPPHARIEEPDDVGHAPFLQKPSVLTEALLRFVSELELPIEQPAVVGSAA